MKEVRIKIGDKEYLVKLAETEEDHDKGLQGVTSLPEDEGMLFIFDEPDEISFWMKDTPIPLDIIFLDEDMIVISVQEGIPNSEDFITENNVNFVLEVNKNSGIKKDDELEFLTDNKVKNEKMHVLDSDGNTQMEIEGGERIVSRKETKVLIRKAKKADLLRTDGSYKSLGNYIFKVLDGQDNRPSEYVKSKN